MMRGSSKLLTDYNYLIHIPAVQIILVDFPELKNYPQNEKEIEAYVRLVWKKITAFKKLLFKGRYFSNRYPINKNNARNRSSYSCL